MILGFNCVLMAAIRMKKIESSLQNKNEKLHKSKTKSLKKYHIKVHPLPKETKNKEPW